MPVSETLEVIKARETLEEIREHRNRAKGAEGVLQAELKKLLYLEVRVLVAAKIHPLSGDSIQNHVQFRQFGETGWSASANQLRPIPGRGLMVGFDVADGKASITLASIRQRCEYLFDLDYFDVEPINTHQS